jgi:hypothetical protein
MISEEAQQKIGVRAAFFHALVTTERLNKKMETLDEAPPVSQVGTVSSCRPLPRQNDLAIALRESGRIERTLFILD